MSEKSLEQTVLDKIHAIEPKFKPVPCQLVGIDGNVFSVMGAVKKALRDAGYNSKPLSDLYFELSTEKDYYHALAIAQIFTVPPDEEDGDVDWDEEEDEGDEWDGTEGDDEDEED